MRTPAGIECKYFYGDYFRGRQQEECRLLVSSGASWTRDLCSTCPVPAITRANACEFMVLRAEVTRPVTSAFRRRVQVKTSCEKTQRAGFDPHIGLRRVSPFATNIRSNKMTITLLLDLDDTLLDTNTETFFPAYLHALSGALSHVVPPETMLPALMSGTKRMMENLDPALTLRQVFDAYFFEKLGVERDSLQTIIDSFYDEVFPTLGSLTKTRPEAIRLVDWAFEQGYRVAIATNPLFPLKAIEHRLRWADLPPEKYPFALVSSYERFHFTKESIAYFGEVMGQMGWPEDPVVMVGNDVDMDLRPAQQAGFPIFWANNGEGASPEFSAIPQGGLDGFRHWLESVDSQTLQPEFNTPQALAALLRSTPAALASLTRQLSSSAWTRSPKPGEWCLTEIIGHLRDVDRDVNLPRLHKLLDEENPFIAGEVTDVWVKERQYARQNGRTSLLEFMVVRKELLALLDDLQTGWDRPARHAIFGPTDLQELIGFIAEHDRVHVKQAFEAIR